VPRPDFRALAARRLREERELPTTYIDPFVGARPTRNPGLHLVAGDRRNDRPGPAVQSRRPSAPEEQPMISKGVRKLLVAQVGSELAARQDIMIRGGTPGELSAFLVRDLATWRKVVQEAGIKAE